VPVTDVNLTPYLVTLDDYFIAVNVAGPSSVVLPVAPIGTTFVIKDVSGNALINPITITATGSTIDLSANYIIDSPFGSITLVRNTLEWNVV
jgi:hypothetical protein